MKKILLGVVLTSNLLMSESPTQQCLFNMKQMNKAMEKIVLYRENGMKKQCELSKQSALDYAINVVVECPKGYKEENKKNVDAIKNASCE